jgi:sugar lactone lactonase YvrE
MTTAIPTPLHEAGQGSMDALSAIDREGNIWVTGNSTDNKNGDDHGWAERYDPSNPAAGPSAVWSGFAAQGIAVDHDDDVWILDSDAGLLEKFSSASLDHGTVTVQDAIATLNVRGGDPGCLTVASDGTVWFCSADDDGDLPDTAVYGFLPAEVTDRGDVLDGKVIREPWATASPALITPTPNLPDFGTASSGTASNSTASNSTAHDGTTRRSATGTVIKRMRLSGYPESVAIDASGGVWVVASEPRGEDWEETLDYRNELYRCSGDIIAQDKATAGPVDSDLPPVPGCTHVSGLANPVFVANDSDGNVWVSCAHSASDTHGFTLYEFPAHAAAGGSVSTQAAQRRADVAGWCASASHLPAPGGAMWIECLGKHPSENWFGRFSAASLAGGSITRASANLTFTRPGH